MNSTQIFDLKNKVIIITGASGFLGTNYKQFLQKLGAKVVNLDLQGKNPVDITDETQVQKKIKEVFQENKRIDVLINNASLNPKINKSAINSSPLDFYAPFDQYPLEIYKKGLFIDLIGAFVVSKAVFPQMKKQKKGIIVNISSVYGQVAPNQDLYKGMKNPLTNKDIVKPVFYSVAKAGVSGLTLYLASYGAPQIRVNQLTLGGIQHNESKEFIKRYSYKTMLGRMGKVEDIYGPLLFLLTDASSYMTGSNLIIDGGFTAW